MLKQVQHDKIWRNMILPDRDGHFGIYGGKFVPETLMPALQELEEVYLKAKNDPAFKSELDYYLTKFVGRPTSLFFAERLTKHLKGAKIYLKREDLCHTGAHKINNTIGQALLTRRMGKRRIIAETGAGQHGVATATVAAMFGLECEIYMGTEDMERQSLNVFRMRLLGSVLGAHPYPMMIRDFQSVIGTEAREQIIAAEGRLPDYLVACVGGGSNAIGLFYPFIDDSSVKMIGVEAAGLGIKTGKHAARFATGSVGAFQGTMTYLLQDKDGQIKVTHSVSAGLDYSAVGPEHSYYKDAERIKYTYATDKEALTAFSLLSEIEGIMPALESAHAVAYVTKLAPTLPEDNVIIVNLSGRGDKDVQQVAEMQGP